MEKYVKIVYQTQPIGPEKIILYLTTFDVEAFERDQQLIQKQEKMIMEFDKCEIQRPSFVTGLENNLNTMVKNFYEDNIKKLQKCKNAKDITNAGDINCNIIYGDVTNCENIYCNEIKGDVINCDKIIYK